MHCHRQKKTQDKHQKRPVKTKEKTYRFQENWRKENDWLRYDSSKNHMYCQVCRLFDKSGKRNAFTDDTRCSSFRYSNVTAHRDSDVHKIAIRACEASKQDVSERPIEKTTD